MNAIAQSAASLAVSVNISEQDWFADEHLASVIKRLSNVTVQVNGVTREKRSMKADEIAGRVRREFRAKFCGVYSKSEAIPAEYNNKIDKFVIAYMAESIGMVHPGNIVDWKRKFHFRKDECDITERVILQGENIITLKEQRIGCRAFITSNEHRKADLLAQGKLTPEVELQINTRLEQLNKCLTRLVTEIEHQEKLVTEVAQATTETK